MDNTKKIYLFEEATVTKALITLSVPTVISSLVMILYNLADTYFVSMLADPIQNAAVTLAAPVLLAFNAVNNLFGVGSSSLMSRALGKKDYEMVKRSSAFGFYLSLLCGLLFSLSFFTLRSPMLRLLGTDAQNTAATAEYLKWTVGFGAAPAILNVVMAYLVRSEGESLHASIGTMSGCLLNIVLDPIFILPFGFNMGAAGAGLATFISNCAACLYFFVLLAVKKNKTYVCINPGKFRPSRAITLGVFAVGVPAAIQNLLNVTGMTVLNNFTAEFGSDAVAAMGIAQKINMIPLYVALGTSQGIMPLVGYNYANGNIKRMKKAVVLSEEITLLLMALMTGMFFAFPGFFVGLFMKNEIILGYGSAFLRGMCLCLPFLSTDFLAVGVFQACGMGKKSLVFATLRKIVLEIPALFILNYFFPLYGLCYAQTVAEIILAAAAVVVTVKMFSRLEKQNAVVKED